MFLEVTAVDMSERSSHPDKSQSEPPDKKKKSNEIREVAFIMWSALILMGGGRSIFLPLSGGGEAFFCTSKRGVSY